MPAPLRLRLEPGPSRIAFALTALACLAAMALVAALPLPWWAMLACFSAAAVALRDGWRRTMGERVPALIHVGIDRTITVTDRRGCSLDGIVDASSYVGAGLTTIVWRANGSPWWRPPDVILIAPGVLPPDDFRRLRIFLRYGRCPTAGTSGVDAG
jgi:membrane protein implicated in regulation of membrane protease activity